MLLSVLSWMIVAQTPLSRQVVPHPTGQNGYEEYLQAAKILSTPEEAVYAAWTPGAKAPKRDPEYESGSGPTSAEVALYDHLREGSPLDVRREERQRFGRALELIAQGNDKRVYDPRPTLDPSTAFPEYASFRTVTRFAVRAATVYAADGQTGRAADLLLDQLTFADNFGRGVLIANLVGEANVSIALAAFDDLLPRLSRPDAVKIQHRVEALLERPAAAREVVPAETRMMEGALRALFESKEDATELFDSSGGEKPDPQAKARGKEFATLSPEARQTLLRSVATQLNQKARWFDAILAGPERDWHSRVANLFDEGDDDALDLGGAIVALLMPSYSGWVDSAARGRTQMRLLDLHAKLLQYRWDHGHYPARLDDVDPLTGRSYLYERHTDGTIRLASRGTAETGEIELRYKRVLPADQDVRP